MGTSSSKNDDKVKNLQDELEAYVEESDSVKRIRAHEERVRISSLIGVDVEDLIWLEDGQGTQSSQYDLVGDRWGGRAIVKGHKLQTQQDLERGKALMHRIQELKQRDLIKQDTNNKESETTVNETNTTVGKLGTRPETTVLLKREREFLRAWWNAKTTGSLTLPEDTILTIPKLLEPTLLRDQREKEETSPTFLIFENLLGKGFNPMNRSQPLTMDDEVQIAKALADLHWGMFQIKEQLKSGFVELLTGFFTAINAAGENVAEIKLGLKQDLENCIKKFGTNFRRDFYEFFITRIDEVAELMLSATNFNWYMHGDPIVENLMLKRDTAGVITGVAFIDFANVGLNSPLLDLFGFVYTSLKHDVNTSTINDVQDAYKRRLSECFPASELPGYESGKFVFGAQDVLISLCKVLRYFLDDLAWNDTDELMFRQLEPFWRLMYLLKNKDEEKQVENMAGTVDLAKDQSD